jgi:Flp pilus assembly protein TadD
MLRAVYNEIVEQSGGYRMKWKCPECGTENEGTQTRCTCGFSATAEEQARYPVESCHESHAPGEGFRSRQEYESWKCRRIRENTEKRRRAELDGLDVKNCFSILGLKPEAAREEADVAYQDLTRVWQPDRFPQDQEMQQKARDKLREIQDAYDRLVFHFNETGREGIVTNEGRSREPGFTPSARPSMPAAGYPKDKKTSNMIIIISASVSLGLLIIVVLLYFAYRPARESSIPVQKEAATIPSPSLEVSFEKDIRQAGEHIKNKDWKGLLDLSQDLARSHPEIAMFWMYQCVANNNLGMNRRAIDSCNQAINRKPDLAEAYAHRAVAYDILGNHQQFIADYKSAARLGYKYAQEYLNLQNIVWNKPSTGTEDKPVRPMPQKSVPEKKDLTRGSDETWFKKGRDLYRNGRYRAAIEEFSRAIKANPDNLDYLQYRGHAYYKSGQYEKSVKDFTDLIGYHSLTSVHYISRGRAYIQIGQRKLALADFKKACNMGDPDGCRMLTKVSSSVQ